MAVAVAAAHVWRAGQDRATKTVVLSGPGKYEIEAGENPINESLEIAVPSAKDITLPRAGGSDAGAGR